MPLFRNAYIWFIGLLIILVLGFWKSYFSQLGQGTVHWTHHFHGIAMLAWLFLLITQSWLIRNRKNAGHRALGKTSIIVAPAVVISAVMVNHFFISHVKDPLNREVLSVFWIGYFSAAIFAFLYIQAIRHRKNMQLHARYMVLTALVFLNPGLVRAYDAFLGPLGVWVPSFYQFFFLPALIALWLMFLDIRKKRPYQPFLIFSLLWLGSQVIWKLAPGWEWFRQLAQTVAGA